MDDETHKYEIGETVNTYGEKKEKLGIVERIVIKEETEICLDKTNRSRNVNYDVRCHSVSIFPYEEKNLRPSKKQLHNDAFSVQNGQVILRDGAEYVVEDARSKSCSGPGVSMGDRGDSYEIWQVKARELKDGKYDPKGKLIEFNQDDEPIDILREMNVQVTYK